MGMLNMLKKQSGVEQLPIELIRPNPFQPRRDFDPEELRKLAESIAENGLIQPITVRRSREGFELIAGERRLRACALLGQKTIPALLCDVDDRECAIWALIENLHRSDLGVFDEASGIARLISTWGIPQDEAAKRLGMASSTLSNKLRLLKLSGEAKDIITKAGLTERHARELLRIGDEKEQVRAALHIAEKSLSVAETEKYVASLCREEKTKPAAPLYIIRDVRLFINTFEHAVGVMNSSGIGAVSTVTESDDSITYSVSIPKRSAFRRAGSPANHKAAPTYPAYTPSVI